MAFISQNSPCQEQAISAQEVSVSSGGRTILYKCSFSFPSNQFTAILGPNGAGKTTLLGLCNGLVTPVEGQIRYFDKPVTAKNASEFRKRIGYVAQWRTLDPRQPITVYESVLSGTYGRLGLFRKPGKRERTLALDALDAVDAWHLKDRPLGQVSGGEAQRIAIARALAQEPELLLLDEPTASLDWQARREVLSLIARLRQQLQLTVVMVTHELNALPELCDRAIFIKSGRIVWEGACFDALDAVRLSEVFGIPVTVLDVPGKPVVLM